MREGVAKRHLVALFLMFPDHDWPCLPEMEGGEFAGVPNKLLSEALPKFAWGDCLPLWPDTGIRCRAADSHMDAAEAGVVIIVSVTMATTLLLTLTAKLTFPESSLYMNQGSC